MPNKVFEHDCCGWNNLAAAIVVEHYGYHRYAGQLLDDQCATYWILPAAFGPSTHDDMALFLDNFAYLQTRFPWLNIGEGLADAGICEQDCLDQIWEVVTA